MIAGACPSLADLLLAAENALPHPAQGQVARHLQACVSCQSTLADAARVISFIGRVRQVMKRLGEGETTNPAEEARFQRFLTALHAHKQKRVVPVTSSPFRRLIPLAATLAVASLFLWETQYAVSAADDLVRQAMTFEQQRLSSGASQLSLRLSYTPAHHVAGVPAHMSEEELLDGIVTRTTAVASDPEVTTLVRMLERHRFDWRQPLSLKRFDAWRRGLAHKHDFVTDLHGAPNIILRTTTEDDGDLREVELTVERDSYRVVRQVLRFEGGGLVEFEVRKQWVRQAPAPAPRESTTTRTERPAPAAAIAALPQPDLRRWLANRFADLSTRETFMPELRRESSVVRQHLEALRRLSGRYPGAEGAQASLSARNRLQRQVDLQYQTLRTDLSDLRARVLNLTIQPDQPQRVSYYGPKPEHAPTDWEDRIDNALTHATTLDRLLGDLRAFEDLPKPMQSRIADAFDGLCTSIYAPQP